MQGRRTDIGTAWSMVWPSMAIQADICFYGHRHFSKLMNTGGIRDRFIWLSLKLGISRSGFVVFSFLASAMISMGQVHRLQPCLQ